MSPRLLVRRRQFCTSSPKWATSRREGRRRSRYSDSRMRVKPPTVEHKTVQLSVRVSETFANLLNECAKVRGTTRADYMRVGLEFVASANMLAEIRDPEVQERL